MVRCNRYFDLVKNRSVGVAALVIQRNSSVSGNCIGFFLRKGNMGSWVLRERFCNDISLFCTSVHPPSLSWEASSQVVLKKKLERALKDHCVHDAWEMFKDFKRLYGLPDNSIMNRFVTVFSYSSDSGCLQKACDLVRLSLKQNPGLLRCDVLTRLSLSLARAQMPEPACNILRALLDRGSTPSLDVSRVVVMHMVKTEIGACLVSNYLVQVCDRFVGLNGEKKTSVGHVVKPDTIMFNLVLGACVRFGFSLKGQELIELMAKTDVIADAHSIVIISCIYEMNGLRDELKKLKGHIDQVSGSGSGLLLCHYRRFYDNLLSLHFKFDDIDSAGQLVLDLRRNKDLLLVQKLGLDPEKPRVLPVGSHHIRAGLKIQIVPELLQRDLHLTTETKTELISFEDAKLVPTNKALAKLVYRYKRHGRISELSKLLFLLGGSRLCADVINACVSLGWLETAHDILDDMESADHPMGFATYKMLLSGYYEQKMVRNAEALLRQMQKAGPVTDLSDETVVLGTEDTETKRTDLYEMLVRELHLEREMAFPHMLYELNSSVYYFCKAKMKGDAVRTYRKIQKIKIQPTLQTLWCMIDMYSSLDLYREITILWGDIKRNMETRSLTVTRDLYEKLVMNFIRGGYFERVLEVISYMKKNRMYVDLSMYKTEFLKLHKNLYRSLRALEARTEAQAKRIEHVQAFRKVVGIE